MRYAADITFPGHWIDIRRFHGGVEPCSRLLLLYTCHFMSQRIPSSRKDRKGEKEKYTFIYLFIYLWPWYTRFNSSRKDLQGSYPTVGRWNSTDFIRSRERADTLGKKKKGGGKKREHPRRGEGLTNSTWLRPAIYSRFKGCAGEFYYSAAEFANLFNDLFAMTNSK